MNMINDMNFWMCVIWSIACVLFIAVTIITVSIGYGIVALACAVMALNYYFRYYEDLR